MKHPFHIGHGGRANIRAIRIAKEEQGGLSSLRLKLKGAAELVIQGEVSSQGSRFVRGAVPIRGG
jgi:hypothetical protein